MIIYHSGSCADGKGEPENHLSNPSLMLSFWSIVQKEMKQHFRFARLHRARKQKKKGKRP